MTSQSTANSKIHRLYYLDTYLCDLTTEVVAAGRDDDGDYIIPLQTIFHPQGGGQPDDEGNLVNDGIEYRVHKLEGDKKEGDIKHYYDMPEGAPLLKEGQTIAMSIDRSQRMLFAAYHTAGHLIAELLAQQYPSLVGVKGNHFPGQGAVVFVRQDRRGQAVEKADYETYDLETIKTTIQESVTQLHEAGAAVSINHAGPTRTMQIADMKAIPCGGTHMRNIKELQAFSITKIAFKKREGIKISYTVQG